jgi:hypothetical protein
MLLNLVIRSMNSRSRTSTRIILLLLLSMPFATLLAADAGTINHIPSIGPVRVEFILFFQIFRVYPKKLVID